MDKKLFSYEADGQALIIHLPKELDHHNCLTLKYETDLLLAENYINRIVFDFSQTEFMDSSGIGVIMGRYKQMSYVGGTVYVYGIGKNVDRIFQMSGLYKLVKQWNQTEVM